MEPEATLQGVSVRCYTEKPFFSQCTGQKEDLSPEPAFIGIHITKIPQNRDEKVSRTKFRFPFPRKRRHPCSARMLRTVDVRRRLCQAGVTVTSSCGKNVRKG